MLPMGGCFCLPDDLAEKCYRLAHQNKSAWSFSTVIRPYGELDSSG